MIDQDLWSRIAEEYKAARQCLYCPRNQTNWHRDEDTGMYHLHCAYQMARTSDEKQPLIYARVLSLMSWEVRNISEYEKLHKFLIPALDAYEKALAGDGSKPYEDEVSYIRRSVAELTYVCERTADNEEEFEKAFELIEGNELLQGFGFHDSKPIYFEHNADYATLKLDYYGIVAVFEFSGLLNIEVNVDPVCNYINEFYCYRLLWNDKYLTFDLGYYKIQCEHVRVKEVEKN